MKSRSAGFPCTHLPSLFDLFRGLTDTRKGQGKQHRLATISLIACAKLSGLPGGYRQYSACPKPEQAPTPCPALLDRPSRRQAAQVPGQTSFFRALKIVTVQQVQAAVDPWLDQKNPNRGARGGQVALDGKTLSHSGVHLVSAIQVPSQRCFGMKPWRTRPTKSRPFAS